MWLDPGAPPQLAGLHNIPPIDSQLVHSLHVYSISTKSHTSWLRNSFSWHAVADICRLRQKNVIFHCFDNLPLSQKLDPRLTCTITCAVLSESVVGSTANFLREIPHSLSCFCRAKFRPTSLVEKPQKEFYFCEAHSCQVAGNLRDAILFEPWIGLHENATSVWQVSLFTLPYCEDDVTVWQRVSVHAAVQSDEVPLALHQHDQLFCAHWGALAGNIAHLQLYT